jgi:hypothetical protein
MKRILAAVLAALIAVSVSAATTWSRGPRRHTAIATFTTGTESAPTGSAALTGLDLTSIDGFAVYVEAAGAMTAGGKFLAYLQNPATGTWIRVHDGSLDLTVSAVATQAFTGFMVAGGTSKLAYIPSGVGQASVLYIVGMPAVK